MLSNEWNNNFAFAKGAQRSQLSPKNTLSTVVVIPT